MGEGIWIIEGILQQIDKHLNQRVEDEKLCVGAYERVMLGLVLRGIWVVWFSW